MLDALLRAPQTAGAEPGLGLGATSPRERRRVAHLNDTLDQLVDSTSPEKAFSQTAPADPWDAVRSASSPPGRRRQSTFFGNGYGARGVAEFAGKAPERAVDPRRKRISVREKMVQMNLSKTGRGRAETLTRTMDGVAKLLDFQSERRDKAQRVLGQRR